MSFDNVESWMLDVAGCKLQVAGWFVLVMAAAALSFTDGSATSMAFMPLVGLLDPMNGFRYDSPDDGGAGGGGDGQDAAGSGQSAGSSGQSAGGGGQDAGGGDPPPDETSSDDMSMDDLASMTDDMSGQDAGGGMQDEPTPPDESGTPPEEGNDPESDSDDAAPPPDGGDEGDGEGVEYHEDFDPNDLVEVDGQEFFFHPDEHAPEGSTQANAYPTRDATEEAWPHKIGTIKEKMESLQEKGRDIGAVDLPDWFPDPEDPEALDEIMDIENPIGWTNEELRQKAGEADKLISHLDDREQRVTQEYEQSQQVQELKEEQAEIEDELDQRIQEMDMQDAVNEVQNLTQLRDKAVEARDQMIADELEPLVEDYKDYKKDDDARLDDENYADNLEQKRKAIEKREQELREKYDEEYLSPFEKAIEIDRKAAELEEGSQSQEVSEEQRMQRRNEAFIDLQKEKKDDHPMFISSDPKGVNNFRNWAINRAEDFGGLTKTYQWNRALKKWDERVENLRKQKRQKQVEDANKRDEDKGEDMPDYGEQDKITSEDKEGYEKDKAELNELAAETDKKHA